MARFYGGRSAVLKAVAEHCKAAVRETDLYARIGGEEFVVMLPETDGAGTVVLAEKIRAIIEDLRSETDAGTLRVTSSIGVTSVTSEDPSIDTALHRADTALYAAKNAGRSRVIVGEEPVSRGYLEVAAISSARKGRALS